MFWYTGLFCRLLRPIVQRFKDVTENTKHCGLRGVINNSKALVRVHYLRQVIFTSS